MKNNKAQGPNNFPAKAPKADIKTSTETLYEISEEIWKEDDIEEEWKEGHIEKLPKNGDLSECGNYRGIMLLSAPGNCATR
jgi:sorting nexin-29